MQTLSMVVVAPEVAPALHNRPVAGPAVISTFWMTYIPVWICILGQAITSDSVLYIPFQFKNMSEKPDLMACIVLPKYSNAGERIDSDVLANYAKKMSELYGGVSVRPTALGCWEDENGKLQCEENIVLCSAIDTRDLSEREIEDRKRQALRLAKEAGVELGQAEVMTWFDTLDSVEFVKGRWRKHTPEGLKEEDFFKKLLD